MHTPMERSSTIESMSLDRFRSHAVPYSHRRQRRKLVQRAIRIPNRWLLLAFAIMGCSLLMGLGLPGWLSQARSTAPVNTTVIEIRYVHPEAGEVFVIWGIDGWQAVSEELRPAGTTLTEKGLMQTPLNLEAGVFTGRLLVPAWSSLDYGFMINATKDGREVAIWDGRAEFVLGVGETDRAIEVLSAVDLNRE